LSERLQPGDKAPDFTLTAVDGSSVSLASYRGQNVVVYFYPAASMVGWHVLIGIGEAVITGLTVSAVVAVRPDLVYAARGLTTALTLRTPDGEVRVAPSRTGAPPKRQLGRLVGIGLTVSLVLAGLVSFYASASPDGLERAAADHGFGQAAADSLTSGSPLAHYGISGIVSERLSVGLAGVIGVGVTVALAGLTFALLARRRRRANAHDHDRPREHQRV
jgi:cobalt/nickel transport system permease protein